MNKSHKLQMTPSFIDEILTAQDVATLLRLEVTTIYALAKSGDLPGFKIGSSWRFMKNEIEKCIADAKLKAKPLSRKRVEGK